MTLTAAWTTLAVLGAFLALVRCVCHINAVTRERVPHRVILLLTFLAAALIAEVIAPLYGVEFDWRDALLTWAMACYLWLDRRCLRTPYQLEPTWPPNPSTR